MLLWQNVIYCYCKNVICCYCKILSTVIAKCNDKICFVIDWITENGIKNRGCSCIYNYKRRMEGGPLILSHCSSSISCSNFQSSLYHHFSVSLWCHRQTYLPCFSSSSSSSSAGCKIRHPKNSKPWLRREIKSLPFVSGAAGGSVTLKETETSPSLLVSGKGDDTYTLPKIDKCGRFCSPRAARELALYSNLKPLFFLFCSIVLFYILIMRLWILAGWLFMLLV